METRTGVEGYRPFPKVQGERGFLAHLKARLVLPKNCCCRGNQVGQGSREVKRDMGCAQVRSVLNEAEQMAQGGVVCLPPQQSLNSSTEVQAHPRAIAPVFERADAPFSQNTEIRTFSRRRNAEKNKKHAKKIKK